MAHESNSNDNHAGGFWHARYAAALMVIGAVSGYFLVTEHWAHILGILPYLLLLACPLMHLCMHHGPGHHGHTGHGQHRDQHAQAEDKPDNRNGNNPV